MSDELTTVFRCNGHISLLTLRYFLRLSDKFSVRVSDIPLKSKIQFTEESSPLLVRGSYLFINRALLRIPNGRSLICTVFAGISWRRCSQATVICINLLRQKREPYCPSCEQYAHFVRRNKFVQLNQKLTEEERISFTGVSFSRKRGMSLTGGIITMHTLIGGDLDGALAQSNVANLGLHDDVTLFTFTGNE